MPFLAYAGAAIGLLNAVVGARQQLRAAKDLENFASQQAAVDIANAEAAANAHLMNALRADFDAGLVRDAGRLALIDVARIGRRQIGAIRVGTAVAGLQESGTILEVLGQQAYETGRAAAATIAETNVAQRRFLLQAEDFRVAANAALIRGAETAKRRLAEAAVQSRTIRVGAYSSLSRGFLGAAMVAGQSSALGPTAPVGAGEEM